MSVNLIVGGGTKGTINVGIQGEKNFFVTGGEEGDWGSREGWALGVGGQLDYLHQDSVGGRVRPLVEANFGYVDIYHFMGAGSSIKGFVQQDLTRNDTYVGARYHVPTLDFPAVSLQVSRNLSDASWHFGGGIGFVF